MTKKIIKPLLIILSVFVILAATYTAYVLLSYNRIEDNLSLAIEGDAAEDVAEVNKSYRLVSANLGFGAYSDDYSFFMDGGTESWAYSKEAVNKNITGSINTILSVNPDIIACQEVDINSTRSYHTNEQDLILNILDKNNYTNTSSTFAINYDSPFLMYPFTQPHGKSQAGILTISPIQIINSVRRSLPIDENLSKLIDLDRCYSKNVMEVENGKKLVLYNVHLSAYSTNPDTADNQIKVLNADMSEELAEGNYIIACGDMNKDMLGDSSIYFGSKSEAGWAKPFNTDYLDDGFTLVGPIDNNNPVPSARNADSPYTKDSFVITIDGFIVSSNVEVEEASVIDSGFKYSDHNPVYMDFILK
ncbi:Metal-dependent hydrolase, endonuclease/exonuclease/phosphatase family [Pseudobutyrivibrio sp. ACV-2]|uniref:endonuclease/exonuclease/phosphatase family protein n=1 Tax=Pseudobutyrivibrio sp. ACV-2 TaxID=1520801 RepID=UPI00089BF290|nr:endonuclease/exonuclease/phosphatase family protein [Pseudobutyrivibrio sp. ACV-2]SDZ79005.1 Metal-dependent hydrolase, endonuclease/exonuclease/phosphatase family [Pseudobutyrivibrio sp. ACV-2]